ncbi:unnamed protein product [Schistosoma turkestanicum]|nr:unnamed protein product [Schistosoma turkestanicum]
MRLFDVNDTTNSIIKSTGRRKYLDLVYEDSCTYFQPYFMKERCLSNVLNTRKLFTEELPATYGGHQNHWRHLDGKVVRRLDYLSDVFEQQSLNYKPNLKRIISLITTTVQPELLGPISRFKLIQMKQKLMKCSKPQNKPKQNRTATKQKKCMDYYNETPLNGMNSVQKLLNEKLSILLTNEYLDEISEKQEEAEQLYEWSQCLPQL